MAKWGVTCIEPWIDWVSGSEKISRVAKVMTPILECLVKLLVGSLNIIQLWRDYFIIEWVFQKGNPCVSVSEWVSKWVSEWVSVCVRGVRVFRERRKLCVLNKLSVCGSVWRRIRECHELHEKHSTREMAQHSTLPLSPPTFTVITALLSLFSLPLSCSQVLLWWPSQSMTTFT